MYREIAQDLLQVEKPVKVVLGILIATGIAFVVWGVEEWVRFQPSLQWPTVPGVILQSEYIALSDNLREASFAAVHPNNHVHWAHVNYRYAVDGTEYISSRISFWSDDLSGGSVNPRAFVLAHPAGATLSVYYAPGHPQTSVLIPGADKILDPGLMLVGAAAVALSVIFYGSQVRKIRRERHLHPEPQISLY